MGSGTEEHEALARPIGALLADLGVNLLTGGGGGVMRAVSRAFVESRTGTGICVGVLPCASESQRAAMKPGYPNEFVELAISTHLPFSGLHGTHDLSRNHINVLSSQVIVALPGETGTASEARLAVLYKKPIVAFLDERSSIPNLDPTILVVRTIEAVGAFLRTALK